MVNPAVAMMIGVEQINPGSVTTDRGKDSGLSFAESFGRQAGLSADMGLHEISGDAANGMHAEKKAAMSKTPEEHSVSPVKMKQEAAAGRMIAVVKDDRGEQRVNAGKTDQVLTEKFIGAEGKSSGAAVRDASLEDGKAQKIVSGGIPQNTSQTKMPSKEAETPEDRPSDGISEDSSGGIFLSQKSSPAQDKEAIGFVPREDAASENRPLPGSEIKSPVLEEGTIPVGNTGDLRSSEKTARVQGETKELRTDLKTAKEPKKAVLEAPVVSVVTGAGFHPVQSFAQNGEPQRVDEIAEEKAGDSPLIFGAVAGGSKAKVVDHVERKDALPDRGPVVKNPEGGIGSTEVQRASPFSTTGDKPAQTVTLEFPIDKGTDGRMQSLVVPATSVHAAQNGEVTAAGVASGVAAPVSMTGVGVKGQSGEAGSFAPGIHSESEHGSVGVDMGENGMAHRTLTATPTTLEVGIPNGTQGWLRVRADMAGDGVVNASLSSTTSAGQEQLHRELPALASYLHDERIAVNAVVVHDAASGSSGLRSSAGSDGGRGGQAQQHEGNGSREQRRNAMDTVPGYSEETTWMGLRNDEDGASPAGTHAGGGWLNVRV